MGLYSRSRQITAFAEGTFRVCYAYRENRAQGSHKQTAGIPQMNINQSGAIGEIIGGKAVDTQSSTDQKINGREVK